MKKRFVKMLSLIGIISILSGVVVEFITNKETIDNILDLSMDANGEVYFLRSSERDGSQLLKIGTSGNLLYNIDLESSGHNVNRVYKQMEIDAKGNIYVLLSEVEQTSADGATNPTEKMTERVIMYDTNGNFIKELVTIESAETAKGASNPYIKKIQVLSQTAYIICNNKNDYEVLYMDPVTETKTKTQQKFSITPYEDINEEAEWINDISVTSSGKVVYSTKRGQMFITGDDGNFEDITSLIGSQSSFVDFSLDDNNNIFFTDAVNYNFYKLDTSTKTVNKLYNSESIVNEKEGIKFKDLKSVFCMVDGDYYGVVKNSGDNYYIRIGNTQSLIESIRQPLFPNRIIVMFLISLAVFVVLFLLVLLINKIRGKISIVFKIESLFAPIYIILMVAIIVAVMINTAQNYSTNLANYQKAAVNILIDGVDGDKFQNLDHLTGYMNDDYINVKTSLDDKYQYLSKSVPDSCDYFISYVVKDGKIYSSIDNEYVITNNKGAHLSGVNLGQESSMFLPIEYKYDSSTASHYYDVLNQLRANPNQIVSNSYVNNYGNWLGVLGVVKNSSGNIVGLIENRVDRVENQSIIFWDSFYTILDVMLVTSALIFIYLFIIMRLTLKPLKSLRGAVEQISLGKWNTKVNIRSKDELGDISMAFNLMTDRIDQSMGSLAILNRDYVRFVPQELFNLLGKKNVTEVKLYDKNIREMNLLYVTFNLVYKNTANPMTEDEYFKTMNDNFGLLFTIVDQNGGIVQWFDGSGMMVLFPDSPDGAVKASMQFREAQKNDRIQDNMRLVLSTGETLIGVVGNEKRSTVTIASDEIIQMNYINSKMNDIGVRHIAIESILNKVKDNSIYHYRFIGQVKPVSGDKPVKIYQLLDNEELYQKKIYLATKAMVEKGIDLYIKGNLFESRKAFASVLRINGEDGVAMHYLSLCDANKDKVTQEWKGYIFN